MEAHSKTLSYQFWQADKRNWNLTFHSWLATDTPGTGRVCFYFHKMPDGAEVKRNPLEIWGHWYRQAMLHQWRRSLGF
jgi:hypothetical protein